jgi:tRNA (guanosine-2'-O-)-methyltransferase
VNPRAPLTRLASFALLAALVTVVTLSAPACLEVPPPPAKDALDVKDVKVSEGVGLESACTPTGVELCFDARDNNCNGVLDEGCGVRTGILQFTIAWDAAEADVDLNVYDAANELAEQGKITGGGLAKDRECPRTDGECQGQNVENVYLSEGEPRPGRYRVEIELLKLNGATAPVQVRLGARLGQRSFGMDLALSPGAGTEKKIFEFSL